jgi:hypothetical protein
MNYCNQCDIHYFALTNIRQKKDHSKLWPFWQEDWLLYSCAMASRIFCSRITWRTAYRATMPKPTLLNKSAKL